MGGGCWEVTTEAFNVPHSQLWVCCYQYTAKEAPLLVTASDSMDRGRPHSSRRLRETRSSLCSWVAALIKHSNMISSGYTNHDYQWPRITDTSLASRGNRDDRHQHSSQQKQGPQTQGNMDDHQKQYRPWKTSQCTESRKLAILHLGYLFVAQCQDDCTERLGSTFRGQNLHELQAEAHYPFRLCINSVFLAFCREANMTASQRWFSWTSCIQSSSFLSLKAVLVIYNYIKIKYMLLV